MMERLEPFTLIRRTETVNAYREKVVNWQSAGTIRAALSEGGGSLAAVNELRRIDSTHTGVTWDAVKTGERIAREGEAPYEVQYVIDGGRRRMHQLFLKRVEGA